MKQTSICRTTLSSVVALAALIAGCASVVVNNDAIEQRTATALGLAKGTFTISDRIDEGTKSSYSVETNAGKQYSCYMTGGISIIGHSVSDAVCSEGGTRAQQAGATTSGASCNALLKAAGKC